jgi:hypothetical protein
MGIAMRERGREAKKGKRERGIAMRDIGTKKSEIEEELKRKIKEGVKKKMRERGRESIEGQERKIRKGQLRDSIEQGGKGEDGRSKRD